MNKYNWVIYIIIYIFSAVISKLVLRILLPKWYAEQQGLGGQGASTEYLVIGGLVTFVLFGIFVAIWLGSM